MVALPRAGSFRACNGLVTALPHALRILMRALERAPRETPMSHAAFFEEDLSLGIPSLDAQHRELVERFERFLSACAQAEERAFEELRRLLDFLASYSVDHFAREERLMEAVAYPRLGAHREQHLRFRSQLAALRAVLDRGRAPVALLVRTRKFVLAWLIHHVRGEDRAAGDSLREHRGGACRRTGA
jgi:hemerythrin